MMFFLSDEMPFSFDELLLFGAASGGKAIEDTATGNPLVFLTDLAKPLKSLSIPFTPRQSGSGDPSPSNIRPIVPWNGLTVFGGGKNLLDSSTLEQGGINADGLAVSNPKRIRTGYIPVKENAYYCLSAGAEYKAFMHFYDKDKGSIGGNTIAKAKAPAGAYFVRGIIGYQEETNIVPADCTTGQIEVVAQSGQATAYEPYKPITETDIVFPSPVYGGQHEAVSGKLTDGWKTETFDGSSDELWNFTQVGTSAFYRAYIRISDIAQDNDVAILADKYKAVSFDNRSFSQKVCMATNKSESPQYVSFITDETTVESFKAWLAENPVTIAYMTFPQTVQLTPEQITALVGNNTLWSDANGDMTAVFFKKA